MSLLIPDQVHLIVPEIGTKRPVLKPCFKSGDVRATWAPTRVFGQFLYRKWFLALRLAKVVAVRDISAVWFKLLLFVKRNGSGQKQKPEIRPMLEISQACIINNNMGHMWTYGHLLFCTKYVIHLNLSLNLLPIFSQTKIAAAHFFLYAENGKSA